jgi:hypothetical protein
MIIEISDDPLTYEMNGKEYNEQEYSEFCERISKKRNNSIIWNESKSYPKEDTIITLSACKGCDPMKED